MSKYSPWPWKQSDHCPEVIKCGKGEILLVLSTSFRARDEFNANAALLTHAPDLAECLAKLIEVIKQAKLGEQNVMLEEAEAAALELLRKVGVV